jgi:uncharacterized protein
LTRRMEFDTFTATLLESRPDAPPLDEKTADAIQDEHMAYLASLHDAGLLQAAGPFTTPPGRSLRGLCLHRLPAEKVLELFQKDPAVRAGQLVARVFTWMVPKGAVAFAASHFPRSMSEV